MSNKDVDSWIKNNYPKHDIKALEKASREFDDQDSLGVNTLEAIYGKETSFGTAKSIGKRNSSGPAGKFQQQKKSAIGILIEKGDDQRFDIDDSSISAARQLKSLDNLFSKKQNLGNGLFSIPVLDKNERKIFVIASYNIGQGVIAKVQNAALKDEKDPAKWNDVKNYFIEVGQTKEKENEVLDYVNLVLEYEKEFIKKSPANKKEKGSEPSKLSSGSNEGGHWITDDSGNRIFIKNKLSKIKKL